MVARRFWPASQYQVEKEVSKHSPTRKCRELQKCRSPKRSGRTDMWPRLRIKSNQFLETNVNQSNLIESESLRSRFQFQFIFCHWAQAGWSDDRSIWFRFQFFQSESGHESNHNFQVQVHSVSIKLTPLIYRRHHRCRRRRRRLQLRLPNRVRVSNSFWSLRSRSRTRRRPRHQHQRQRLQLSHHRWRFRLGRLGHLLRLLMLLLRTRLSRRRPHTTWKRKHALTSPRSSLPLNRRNWWSALLRESRDWANKSRFLKLLLPMPMPTLRNVHCATAQVAACVGNFAWRPLRPLQRLDLIVQFASFLGLIACAPQRQRQNVETPKQQWHLLRNERYRQLRQQHHRHAEGKTPENFPFTQPRGSPAESTPDQVLKQAVEPVPAAASSVIAELNEANLKALCQPEDGRDRSRSPRQRKDRGSALTGFLIHSHSLNLLSIIESNHESLRYNFVLFILYYYYIINYQYPLTITLSLSHYHSLTCSSVQHTDMIVWIMRLCDNRWWLRLRLT